MKRGLSILLALCMLLLTMPTHAVAEDVQEFRGMNDPSLLSYMEDALYDGLLTALDGGNYAVEDVRAVYISQEYLDELAYNSQANLFFGYTIAELDAQFEGTRYVFMLDEHNETGVKPFEAHEDDTYTRVLKNVAIGAGVILICVTVSVLSAPGAPAVSLIFACAAKTGTALAMSGGTMGFLAAGVLEYMQTGNLEKAFQTGLLKGSEGFKWGAIGGSLMGGTTETAILSVLRRKMHITLSEAALIQKEKKFSLSFLRSVRSMEEYEIYKKADLVEYRLESGEHVLLPKNFKHILESENAKASNLELMKQGLNPVDSDGITYEWHHVSQEVDSPLALLTKAQHHDNHGILHPSREPSQVHPITDTATWQRTRRRLNQEIAKKFGITP